MDSAGKCGEVEEGRGGGGTRIIGKSTSHRDEHAGKATVDTFCWKWKTLAEPSSLLVPDTGSQN